jgi:hypothetical protein
VLLVCWSDAFGWLYACRGFYQLGEFHLVIDGIVHCVRNEKTMKEAQHLLAFALLHTRQNRAAVNAFYKSIRLGNETDWQPLIELLIEKPKLQLMHNSAAAANAEVAIAAMQRQAL